MVLLSSSPLIDAFAFCFPYARENESERKERISPRTIIERGKSMKRKFRNSHAMTLPIYTANGQTEITGKGTVIFTVDGCTIRVYPIYYIPDIKTRLLSLGQFLQSRLHSRESACDITLYKGQEEFLAFHP